MKKERGGYRMGNGKVIENMLIDGMEDEYEKGRMMGKFEED